MLFTATKKLFSFSRYWDFCFSVFPYFFPCGHCCRGWFNTNCKVHNVINCQYKTVNNILFDTLRRKKFETLLIDGTFFWKNHSENVHEKVVLDFFLILINIRKKLLHARHYFKNKIFWKRITKKPCNFIFSFEPGPF